MKIYEISCEICQDLIPLVKDDIAGEDTRNAVYNHINSCETCHTYFLRGASVNDISDRKLLQDIKLIVILWTAVICLCSMFVSLFLPGTPEGIAVTIIALPTLSAFGYVLLHKKWLVVPLCVFTGRFAVQALARLRDAFRGNFFHITAGELFSNLMIVSLCFIGVAVYKLIRFSVSHSRKEK